MQWSRQPAWSIALPIVDELSTIDPKTAGLKEVADAYRKYGVPMIQSYTQDPISSAMHC